MNLCRSRLVRIWPIVSLLAAPAVSQAAEAETLADQARRAMSRATEFMRSISTEGGYLWRYSLDLEERAGENAATATQIWVQPPGTSAMGSTFLRAYDATNDARYLEAAKAAADALAAGQLESGGWDYLVEFDPQLNSRWYRRTEVGKISAEEARKRVNVSTYDDDNTQSALRLLLAVADVSKDSDDPRDRRIREARDYGLKKLLEAQRPTGGWPQRWDGRPVKPEDYPARAAKSPEAYPREHSGENYMHHYTLNDHTQHDCVTTLLEAAKRLDRADLRAAALKGGDFLLLAQLPEPQPAWAQQYNAHLEPAWARAFEPPSVCSNESASAMDLLLDLYLETGDKKYLEPLPRAIAWLERSEIRPNVWARLYELGTNKPIYGDRDGKIHYTREEISPERQRGYAWEGGFNIRNVIARFERVKNLGPEKVKAKLLAGREREDDRSLNRRALEAKARTVIDALDDQGRWVGSVRGTPAIRTDVFIANLRTLADYLEATK